MNRIWLFILLSFIIFQIKAQTLPLSTQSGRIIDAEGKDFIIKGVNWWGANGSQYPYNKNHSKNTDTHAMPFGLHVQKLETIAELIKNAGFNSVRLPFSNQMLHDNTKVLEEWVGPNQQLIGLTPLEVMDKIINALTDKGIYVLLNNHSTTTHWCCNYDFNGLWYGKNKHYSQSPKQWVEDWKMLAKRYKNNPLVIGADLRNEVRPMRMRYIPLPKNPKWGTKTKNDWHKWATLAGNAILKENPNLLIVVEGINAQTKHLTKLKFPHLLPVIKKPVVLELSNKLVYEVHNYTFSWVKANLLKPKKQIRYQDLSSSERKKLYEKYWGFVAKNNFKYSTPVIVGEFGCSSLDEGSKEWLKDLTDYIADNKLGFCWWTLEEELDNKGSYGLMNAKMDQFDVMEDWRWKYLSNIIKN